MKRRTLLAAAVGLAAGTLAGCAAWREGDRFDAVVSRNPSERRAAKRFATLQAAIDAAPENPAGPFRILVTRGEWREKLTIDRPFVHLVGEDRAASILTYDAAAGDAGPDGKALGTWGCASVIVRAADFAARNLTIRNSFDYLAHLYDPKYPAVGSNSAQAVALLLAAGADRTLLADVNVIGHQDTLFADAGRSLVRHCHIAGSVDFIFGGGAAVFDRCEILSRFRPGKERQGYLAAPSTRREQEFGLTFRNCRLLKERAVPPQTVALGRAWRPTRTFADGNYGDPQALGAAAFLNCWMDDHIAADGWDPMNYTARDGSRVPLDPQEARLFEYASAGPGSRVSARRRTLTAAEARRYTPERILDGWRPPSG
jgi:pectinesterase